MTGRRLSLGILAGLGVLALGAWVWRAIGAGRGGALAGPAIAIEAAIAEIEAGRRTTPLVGEPAAGGERVVTFLARQEGGQPPRIVSDVTGWGEHVDGTFDFSTGTMARVGQSDWYLLRAEVAPRARIEYSIAYGQADYRLDPHNPRRSAGPEAGGLAASELVMPDYVPPEELAGPRASPAGVVSEADIPGPCQRVRLPACRRGVHRSLPAGGLSGLAIRPDFARARLAHRAPRHRAGCGRLCRTAVGRRRPLFGQGGARVRGRAAAHVAGVACRWGLRPAAPRDCRDLVRREGRAGHRPHACYPPAGSCTRPRPP